MIWIQLIIAVIPVLLKLLSLLGTIKPDSLKPYHRKVLAGAIHLCQQVVEKGKAMGVEPDEQGLSVTIFQIGSEASPEAAGDA